MLKFPPNILKSARKMYRSFDHKSKIDIVLYSNLLKTQNSIDLLWHLETMSNPFESTPQCITCYFQKYLNLNYIKNMSKQIK